MDATTRKGTLYEQFARVGRALGNPLRLVLLDLLAQAERSVEDLATTAEATLGNTSAQLQVLRTAGLVATRKSGNRVYYRLATDEVTAVVIALSTLAEHQVAEAERAAGAYLGDLDGLEPVDHDELRRRLETGRAVAVDVRPAAEYAAGHIPGARNIPIDELATRLDELPVGTDIVAYCRGPYCVYAPHAARLLAAHGFTVSLFQDGLPGWRRFGLPVETAQTPLDAAS